MTALVRIRSERDRMSAIERRIADFVLENAHLLRDYSSQQLADALGISQSSVVKFCQKQGFRGYPDLKLSINEAVVRADSGTADALAHAHAGELPRPAAGLWQRKSEAEQATRLINPPEALDAVVEVAGLRLDPATRRVTRRLGEELREIKIGPTEFRLLHFFMTHTERPRRWTRRPRRSATRAQCSSSAWARTTSMRAHSRCGCRCWVS